MINILVVDDHALIRNGLKQLLDECPGMQVTGEAETGMQAICMVRNNHYDVVLLDLALPDKHGMDVLMQLKSEKPDIRIIVLSMHPEDQYGVRMLKAGAFGYINKQSAPEKMVGAIQHVVSGQKYISENLAEQLLSTLVGNSGDLMHQCLSNREYQTLCLIASGHSLAEISEIMLLSPKTVSVYRARMLEKMGFKNNAKAVQYAISNHLVDAHN